MSSSEYGAVVRQTLKLKRSTANGSTSRRKRKLSPSASFGGKSPSSATPDSSRYERVSKERRLSVDKQQTVHEEERPSSHLADGLAEKDEATGAYSVDGTEERDTQLLTPAERAFSLAQKRREKQRTAKRIEMTHRQRMEKFNAHLTTLSEHFDIPKVGPG